MRIKDDPTDLGLGFTLELKLKMERKEMPWKRFTPRTPRGPL
jgi:hypothetical protein